MPSMTSLDYARDGSTVLCLAEEMVRGGRHNVVAVDLHSIGRTPNLTVKDVEDLLNFLAGLGYFKRGGMYGGVYYKLTEKGKAKAWHQRTAGKVDLEFADPDHGGNQFEIGRHATAPFQIPINTGSGTIHATQTNNFAPERPQEVLDLLKQLRETLDRLAPSTDRELAISAINATTEAAEQGGWQMAWQRMNGALSFLAVLAALTVDGKEALQIGEQVVRVLTGGT